MDSPESLVQIRASLDLDSTSAGPKTVKTMRARRSPLTPPAAQLSMLQSVPLPDGEFQERLRAAGWEHLTPAKLEILQLNLGKLCNMACRHCHVDAGPDRVDENMDRETIDECLALLDRTDVHTVDLTGGAPELNPHFRHIVTECRSRGRHVIDRSNLTVLLLKRFRDLPEWLGELGVEIVASLPHYRQRQTDAQRGDTAHTRSIEALKLLNAAGYGRGDPDRVLTLMHNPAGAFLPSGVASMERTWKDKLTEQHGVTFDRLIALNNLPISRFLEWLVETGNLEDYLGRLARAFNPATIGALMCRNTLSVGYDGRIYDCDFNQMLEMSVAAPEGMAPHIRDFDERAFAGRKIATARHCFGCTAGAGSSCGGTLA